MNLLPLSWTIPWATRIIRCYLCEVNLERLVDVGDAIFAAEVERLTRRLCHWYVRGVLALGKDEYKITDQASQYSR